ncbi:SDR family oxidoreductase [Halieaceae bacterium IMCC14734]|uniref:SDR family oxidoreductase n=1 Tax=Candidatus Litorirhabdus singularis TaxID=2518993 RepID=A0ABT3TJS4_9GAMM|nr:SDR family oxidoreductase [Candidatus Litorirhabdus singularis]MCX2982021.1 SDR family oxidoreductase [Candidatus Litorirhabdus singularis]
MTKSLQGKVAIVTGGNAGIGRATARLFAAEGAKTVVCARRIEEGEQTVRDIVDAGGIATFIQADVSKAADVKALIDQTVHLYGRVDCLFSNAGISGNPGTPIVDLEEEEWDQVININLKGVWLGMKYVIPVMQQNGGGSIINMSSIYGLMGSHLQMPAYTASKHGVIGLTKSGARDYAPDNIRINAICPAYIHTEMVDGPMAADPQLATTIMGLHPIGRLGTVEEIAEAVLWLASDKSSFVTGHSLTADGGLTLG